MTERLIIKNFGPIKEVDIELKPIMVFIGNQATGKSTISKLIALFRAWEFVLNKDNFEERLKHYNIASYKTPESYIKFTSDSFSFELSNGKTILQEEKDHIYYKKKENYDKQRKLFNNDINSTLIKTELNNIKIELTGDGNITSEREIELKKREAELNKELEKHEIMETALTEFAVEVFKLENYSEYIPSERIFVSIASGSFMNLSSNKVPLPETLLSFGAEFEKARVDVKTLDIHCLSGKYKYENNEDRIYIGDNKHIPFRESASGFQTLIPMLLVIEYKTRSSSIMGRTFIIEEPELNLFPSTQKHLTQILVEKCVSYVEEIKRNNELIITTHSPYILASLNNLLLAHKIGTKNSEMAEKVSTLIPKNCWIDGNNFSAYSIEGGQLKNLVNSNTLLIAESDLDSASEEINIEFDALMDIYSTNAS
jgi:predicted ATPase